MEGESFFMYVRRTGNSIVAFRICGERIPDRGGCIRAYGHTGPHEDQSERIWDAHPDMVGRGKLNGLQPDN